MTVLVDDAARARVETLGLDETLFVEAGAGTGKTHELVERVVRLVIDRGVRLRAIAAITFTEAAAAELRDRIREAFERRLEDSGLANDERAACIQALADADDAAIGTLHSFCLRILSEHPVEVGLPPRVEIMDEVRSQLAFEARWKTFVDSLFADPDAEDLLLRAFAVMVPIEPRGPNGASLKDVAAIFDDSWDRLDAVASVVHPPLPAIDFSPFENARAALREWTAPGHCNDPDDKLLTRIEGFIREMQSISAEADILRKVALLQSHGVTWTKGSGGKGAAWDDKAGAQGAIDTAREAAAVIVSSVTDAVLARLATRLAAAAVEAAEARRLEGRLEFHDLLVLARRLVRSSPTARASLHARYVRLLLDEFQDTDPIQIEVAVLVAAAVAGDDRGTTPWPEVPVEEGRLFFVGDPKQSIYRFRRADIGLFLDARKRFAPEATGGPLQLVQNFRTVPTVLDWVNGMFGELMRDEVPGRQPAYVRLEAARQPDRASDHRVLVLGGPAGGRAGDLRATEAADVAATIAGIRKSPARWQVQDKDGGWRDPTMADITILLPTRTSLRALEDALDVAHIPYRVATGTLVYDTQEVREVLDALRAVDDPAQHIAVVSALRSPLFACSDVDLFTWRQAKGTWDLRRDPPEGLADHPVARALACLREVWEQRWWAEPSALLDGLLQRRQAFALAFAARRPREVWRRLRFVVDQARAFEESGGGGLRAFLLWADLQRNEGSRVHEPILAETDDVAVSIMTIHGAKGLEFPITIVSGTTTQMRNGRMGVQVHWDDDGTPAVRLSKTARTENFDRLADIESEMDDHERRRLLYVACTRARDHLVVCAHHKPGAASYGGWIHDVTGRVDAALWRRPVVTVAAGADEPEGFLRSATSAHSPPLPASAPAGEVLQLPLLASGDDADEWRIRRQALLDAQAETRMRSATAIAELAAGHGRGSGSSSDGAWDDEDNPEFDGDWDDEEPIEVDETSDGPPIPWRRGRAGTAVGRAVHATLQLVDLSTGDGVEALAAQQAELEAVPDAVGTITALARSALGAPTIAEAVRAPRVWRELFVAAPLGDRAVEGYVDLLFQRPDGSLVLVDYKTDSFRTDDDVDAKVSRYRLQTAAYAVALERATGLSVDEARLVFCTSGPALERVVPELAAAKAEVAALIHA